MSLDVHLEHRLGDFRLDVAFQQPEAGVTALAGPSGAGKTTVLNAVAGLLRPDRGHVRLGARTLLDTTAGVFVPARRRRLACVFQNARLFPHLSVRANLLYGHRRSPAPAPAAEIDAYIDLLGIGDLLDRRPATLSGGEQQRVAIGRALLSSPDMLLLDEPLAALDPGRRHEVMNCLERLRDTGGVPMLYVSHRREEIARLADQVVLIESGRVVASGDVHEMLAASELADRFDGGADGGAPTTVLSTRVAAQDDAFGLTELDSPLGRLTLPHVEAAVGATLRISIRAQDITLLTQAPTGASANNIIEGRVVRVRDAGASWADVELRCGEQLLVARITRRSAHRLLLAPEQGLWAMVKATTIRR
ncbi:MAG TPA: molybdenum ABC transporter ATP-binding protein [Pseudomonadales bacterium]|nr:molybdenum ABC transporter ATP-binding protein [Pseudomonadales bacterium]